MGIKSYSFVAQSSVFLFADVIDAMWATKHTHTKYLQNTYASHLVHTRWKILGRFLSEVEKSEQALAGWTIFSTVLSNSTSFFGSVTIVRNLLAALFFLHFLTN